MIAFLRKRFVWALFAGLAAYVRRRYRKWRSAEPQPAAASAPTAEAESTEGAARPGNRPGVGEARTDTPNTERT